VPNEPQRMKEPEIPPATQRRLLHKLKLRMKVQEVDISVRIGCLALSKKSVRII
jgi:hypothetical protein